MATPGDLVKAMAMALGISEATVVQFDRQLVAAGLRSKSGRGRSAARVTPGDAANLLISIAASPITGLSVKDAAQTCTTYRALPNVTRAVTPEEALGSAQSEPFGRFGKTSLNRGDTFGVALSQLISLAVREEAGLADAKIFVDFEGPNPHARITGNYVGEDGKSGFSSFRYATPFASIRGDLHQRRLVSYRTIQALGKLFS